MFDALFVFLVGVERKTESVQQLRVIILRFQTLLQILNGELVPLLVVVTLSSMGQEVGIIRLLINSIVIVLKSLFVILQGVVSTSQTILNSPVGLKSRRISFRFERFKLFSLLEFLNSSFMVLLSMLTLAKSIVGLR